MSISVSVKFNNDFLDQIEKNGAEVLWMTAEALHTDVLQEETIPRDTGTLQGEGTAVNKPDENGIVEIYSNTPYAQRLYFHPELNFSHEENANAGAYWFEPYISGDKADFVLDTFVAICDMKGGLL